VKSKYPELCYSLWFGSRELGKKSTDSESGFWGCLPRIPRKDKIQNKVIRDCKSLFSKTWKQNCVVHMQAINGSNRCLDNARKEEGKTKN
jgi:hypothetical protein